MIKSTHAKTRQQQRGMRNEVLEFILDYGCIEVGEEDRCYSIRENLLPHCLRGSRIVELAKRWVVVITRYDRVIKTSYARKDPGHYIRRKNLKPHISRRKKRQRAVKNTS